MVATAAFHSTSHDTSGHPHDYRIVTLNRAFFWGGAGLRAGEVVGRSLFAAIPDIDESLASDTLQGGRPGPRSAEEASQGEDATEIPGGKEHILFVDDEPMIAEMAQDMLEQLGYRVTTCQSSIAALAAFTRSPERFDLLITDQAMPDLTGMELAQRILEIRPALPIILCTGFSNLIDESSAKAIGIKAFYLQTSGQPGTGQTHKKGF